MNGTFLIVDASLSPRDGSLLVCRMDGELRIKRYRNHPKPHLEDLQTGSREEMPAHDHGCDIWCDHLHHQRCTLL